jgi:hypothetical protein
MATTPINAPTSEKYMIAFVIQGDDIFRVTADNIVHTSTGPNDGAFDGVAKLKAAAALMELTNVHNERPVELRRMAREMAAEGLRLLARFDAAPKQVAPAMAEKQQETTVA